MDDLVQFLRDRLDEDERTAREAAMSVGRTGYKNGVLVNPPARFGDDLVADGAQWVSSHHLVVRKRLGPEEKGRIVADCGGFGARPVAVHAAAHDPARVLAEVEAKRRVIERCTAVQGLLLDDFTAEHLADEVLALIALPYADHPDYREEWRP
ncbi:DUF6221 family protein [Streptomyces sp. NPDC094143]|uniref:DUF6221 family protein n=1 Tax=Streptomyces sp. NPDC094143 TaxID=3155310 RepID=UPI0033252268